jgi:hypothetical protein
MTATCDGGLAERTASISLRADHRISLKTRPQHFRPRGTIRGSSGYCPMTRNRKARLGQFAARGKIAAAFVLLSSALAVAPSSGEPLKSPAEFASIANRTERSRAIFGEIGKLVTHPRCMNCHPAGDHPLQGDDQHEHMPPVWRGETGHLETNCAGCHTERNVTLHEAASYKSIPGNPRWGVAPLSMAWQNKSLGEICRQLKDVNLNGGRDLALLQEHIAKDDLVAHGWDPGEGREPAPGSQEAAGQLVQAWIDSGAECPP